MAARKADTDCKAAGKGGVTLLALPGTITCALALKEDRANAIIVSTPTVAALEHDSPDAFSNGGAPFATDTKVGIAIGQDNPALKADLQRAMQAVFADGTYGALLKKWNFPPSSSAF